MGGFQLGSAIGLTLSPILMSQAGVFGPFIIFGLCGFLWVIIWISATTSTPDQNFQISRYELEYIRSMRPKSLKVENDLAKPKVIPPFRRLLSKMPTWSIIVANAMHSWVCIHSLSVYTLSVEIIICFGLIIVCGYIFISSHMLMIYRI